MTKRTWTSTVSSIFQFIIGFLLGILLITSVGAGIAYFYFTKMSSHVPEKPVYEEKTISQTITKKDERLDGSSSEIAESETTSVSESAAKTELDREPEPIPEPELELPTNAYYARVTWSQGLSLRAEPSLDAERVGGIGYNARIIILEETSDKKWQRILVPESQQEAWVKAGNVKKD